MLNVLHRYSSFRSGMSFIDMAYLQDAYLIDVREADEVAQGSIPSAVSVPLSVLPNSLTMKPDEFFLKFGFLKPKRDQEAVFYCRSGKRSATACDIAFKNGFTKYVRWRHLVEHAS